MPLLLLLAAAVSLVAPPCAAVDDRLIGWKGETFNQADHTAAVHGERESAEEKARGAWIEVLSWSQPRALIYHNLLTEEESEHLKDLVRSQMRPSMVVDSVTGQSKFDPIRTSNNGYLRRGQDDVVKRVEEKLARFSMIPVENGEDIQILSYRDGQKYDAHHDVGELNSKSGQALASNGGHRVATALMYLNDLPEDAGGETVFPLTDWTPGDPRSKGPWSECGGLGIAARPRKGDVLLFYSVDMYGKIDEYSMHGSCPTFKGEKWTATKWIHQSEFVKGTSIHPPKKFRGDGRGCDDKHTYCKWWGASGECDKNPGFMMGANGSCRFSCKSCPSMAGTEGYRDYSPSRRHLAGRAEMPTSVPPWVEGARGGGEGEGEHDGILVQREGWGL